MLLRVSARRVRSRVESFLSSPQRQCLRAHRAGIRDALRELLGHWRRHLARCARSMRWVWCFPFVTCTWPRARKWLDVSLTFAHDSSTQWPAIELRGIRRRLPTARATEPFLRKRQPKGWRFCFSNCDASQFTFRMRQDRQLSSPESTAHRGPNSAIERLLCGQVGPGECVSNRLADQPSVCRSDRNSNLRRVDLVLTTALDLASGYPRPAQRGS